MDPSKSIRPFFKKTGNVATNGGSVVMNLTDTNLSSMSCTYIKVMRSTDIDASPALFFIEPVGIAAVSSNNPFHATPSALVGVVGSDALPAAELFLSDRDAVSQVKITNWSSNNGDRQFIVTYGNWRNRNWIAMQMNTGVQHDALRVTAQAGPQGGSDVRGS